MMVEVIRPGKILSTVNVKGTDGKWYSHQIIDSDSLADIKLRDELHYEEMPAQLKRNDKPIHSYIGWNPLKKEYTHDIDEPKVIEAK